MSLPEPTSVHVNTLWHLINESMDFLQTLPPFKWFQPVSKSEAQIKLKCFWRCWSMHPCSFCWIQYKGTIWDWFWAEFMATFRGLLPLPFPLPLKPNLKGQKNCDSADIEITTPLVSWLNDLIWLNGIEVWSLDNQQLLLKNRPSKQASGIGGIIIPP